ncbi:MAG: undecaprenyl-phosphate glucose phosphotransferase [Gammaproteobacteria bacterium]|nr:undecaprenyl-phosphate glucose phosphotransferase [Gammaproteobacteria bacterium]
MSTSHESMARGMGRVVQKRSQLLTPETVPALIGLLDFLIIVATGLIIFWFYLGWRPDKFLAYCATSTVAAVLIVQSFYVAQLYRLDVIASPFSQAKKIVLICSIVFMCLVTFLFALKHSEQLSRVWFFSWFLTSTGLLGLTRIVLASLLISAGKIRHKVVMVGAGKQGERLLRHLLLTGDRWVEIDGVFDDRTGRRSPDLDHPVLGDLDDLIAHVRQNHSNEVIIALPWSADTRIREVLNRLTVLPVRVSLGPDLAALNFLPSKMHRCGVVTLLEILREPLSGWRYFIKLIEDWVFGGLLFLLALPLMLVTALLIKLDSRGPVLFQQQRYGFNNQLITVLKFRTMHADCIDVDATKLACRNDTRITRVGSILRRTSLDELPQLWNVLKGEMSMVGPRPHALQAKAGDKLYSDVVAEYAARHNVKPGITGWAQVNGWRGETDTDDKLIRRVEHDLYYIENWGVLFDLKILLLTFGEVVRGRNAY